MSRCFMNGKSCIYERDIDDRHQVRGSNGNKTAFVIMPFGEQLNVLYQWEIAPFFRNGGKDPGDPEYCCETERADDVRQVGFIICEKICRKIQEADFVVADLTFDNPNVFYELGLAAALRKTIIPMCAADSLHGRQELLDKALGINRPLPYPRFDMLEVTIRDFVWSLPPAYTDFDLMSGDHIAVLHNSAHKLSSQGPYQAESDFGALCRTAVGTAVARIFSSENMQARPELKLYGEERFKRLRVPRSVDLSKQYFRDVIDACKSAACTLVDVSDETAIANFFWLGYIHGIGGNAIPVNSYQDRATPFDIRALWHIAFREDHPIDLLESLQQILEHIYIRRARNLNRAAFWKDILKDNKVSIFLGSLYLDDLGRNTIGDWDYRAAAEVANYLSSSKETMKVTLESPLPKREGPRDEAYTAWLESQLCDNSIIIASPDVNDLTEVALCKILRQTPFRRIAENNKDFKGYIGHKKYRKLIAGDFPETAFYVREKSEGGDSRGYIIRQGTALNKLLEEPHAYPADEDVSGVRRLLGQLVVAPNPVTPDKWIVIISGISGPATHGIAQMLTGCMYKEFTINSVLPTLEKERGKVDAVISQYRELVRDGPSPKMEAGKVPYEALSEFMLGAILKVRDKAGGAVNALVAVDVYYPPRSEAKYSNDERKVIGWQFVNVSDFTGTQWSNPNDLFCRLTD